MTNHYKNLCELPGISGNESRIRQYMQSHMEKYKDFKIIIDRLGGIYAYKTSNHPNAKTLLIAGNMDEVGLMVKSILKIGHLALLPIGGLSEDVFISQVMYVYTKSGDKIP